MTRFFGAICVLPVVLFMLVGCPNGLDKPDLRVMSLSPLGSGVPMAYPDGTIGVPVHVVVRNQGTRAANPFKVALRYELPSGETFYCAFLVQGESSAWYPMTDTLLLPGTEVMFGGSARMLASSVSGKTVTLWAVADSTAGDEFAPETGFVDESDETNNVSAPLSVVIP